MGFFQQVRTIGRSLHVVAGRAFLLLAFFFPSFARAQTEIKAEHSGLRIFSLQTMIRDNESIDALFDFVLEPGWHIYWRNPGDSGAPPRVQVQGGQLVEWKWPAPERISLPPLTNYGYEARVSFPVILKPDVGVREMVLRFEWLVCKVECVPVLATMKIPVVWGSSRTELREDHPDRILWEEAARRLSLKQGTPRVELVRLTSETATLRISGKDLAQTEEIQIFPFEKEIFRSASPQIDTAGGAMNSAMELRMPLDSNRDPTQTEVNLTVVLKGPLGQKAFDVKVHLQEEVPALWYVLLLAFAGGLLLNLMPCVFPVLALKVFAILREPNRTAVRRSGWLYAAGVLFSFLILGAGLLLLRAGGEALGWGFQLQSPAFVLAMLILFFLMALNFMGFIDFGDWMMARAGALGSRRSLAGSFGTGILAVFVASPCTAPFMGSALGATLLLPPVSALAVFAALGLGLAFPILFFGEVPGLAKRLPRPGPWMQHLKEFMAFPMFATAAWLWWVLQMQVGANFGLQCLLALIILSFSVWLSKRGHGPVWHGMAALFFIATLLWLFHDLRQTQPHAASRADSAVWQNYSPEKVQNALSQQAVFIDFTAAWCITCQVNKIRVLNTTVVQQMMKSQNVLLLRADWTDRDPMITEALKAYGRNSVPLYVYYSKDGDAQVLPELLTTSMIKGLFETRRSQ